MGTTYTPSEWPDIAAEVDERMGNVEPPEQILVDKAQYQGGVRTLLFVLHSALTQIIYTRQRPSPRRVGLSRSRPRAPSARGGQWTRPLARSVEREREVGSRGGLLVRSLRIAFRGLDFLIESFAGYRFSEVRIPFMAGLAVNL